MNAYINLSTVTRQQAEDDRSRVVALCAVNLLIDEKDLWTTWSKLVEDQIQRNDPMIEIYLSSGAFSQLIACSEFLNAHTPSPTHEEVLTGKVATSSLGYTVYTEAFRHPEQRILTTNEVLFNTKSDGWLRISIKDAPEGNNMNTQTTDSIEQEDSKFSLNKETRNAYAFLKANPVFNTEDAGISNLFDVFTEIVGSCSRDKDPVQKVVLSSHMYNEFLSCTKLIMCLEPATTIRDIMKGKVGKILGSTLYTEAYSHPAEQGMGCKEILFHTLSDKWIRISFSN